MPNAVALFPSTCRNDAVSLGRLWLVRLLAAIGALTLSGVVLAVATRRPLLEWALPHFLGGTVLEVRSLTVEQVGLTETSLSNIKASAVGQDLAIEKVRVELPQGPLNGVKDVTIEGLNIRLDPSALKAFASSKPDAAEEHAPLPLPFEKVTVHGRASLGSTPDAPSLSFDSTILPGAKPGVAVLSSALSGSGIDANVNGHLDTVTSTYRADFNTLSVDLSRLQPILRGIIPELGDFGTLTGQVRVSGNASFSGSKFEAKALVSIHDGTFVNSDQTATASGIECTLDLVDVLKPGTAPLQRLKVARAQAGERIFENTEIIFTVLDSSHVHVESVVTQTLGGQVSIAPFELDLDQVKMLAPVTFEHIDLAQLVQLLPDAQVRLTGRASGRVPIGWDGKQVVIGRGSITLDKDVPATLRLDHPGLITGNTPPSSPAYAVLKKVEGGLLNLQVTTLSAEIFATQGELERSVLLHVDAAPMDPNVKAPVSLDVNINGPVARLINWGLDSRVQFSTAPDPK